MDVGPPMRLERFNPASVCIARRHRAALLETLQSSQQASYTCTGVSCIPRMHAAGQNARSGLFLSMRLGDLAVDDSTVNHTPICKATWCNSCPPCRTGMTRDALTTTCHVPLSLGVLPKRQYAIHTVHVGKTATAKPCQFRRPCSFLPRPLSVASRCQELTYDTLRHHRGLVAMALKRQLNLNEERGVGEAHKQRRTASHLDPDTSEAGRLLHRR